MKSTILIATLLVLSIFAGAAGLVMADLQQDEDEKLKLAGEEVEVIEAEPVQVSEIETEPIPFQEIETAIEEFEPKEGYKKVGFTRVTRGDGWMTNGDDGHLVHGFWAVQSFAKIDPETKEVIDSQVKAFGRLHISKAESYKIIKISKASETNSAEFYVIPLRTKIENLEELENIAIGTLSLDKEHQYSHFAKWKGHLEMESGRFEGEWDLEVGTTTHVIKPQQNPLFDPEARTLFWNKFKFWKNWGKGKQITSSGEPIENPNRSHPYLKAKGEAEEAQ